jgi:hypothetical protein
MATMVRIISIPDWLFQAILSDDNSLLMLSSALQPSKGKPAALVESRTDDSLEGKVDFN